METCIDFSLHPAAKLTDIGIVDRYITKVINSCRTPYGSNGKRMEDAELAFKLVGGSGNGSQLLHKRADKRLNAFYLLPGPRIGTPKFKNPKDRCMQDQATSVRLVHILYDFEPLSELMSELGRVETSGHNLAKAVFPFDALRSGGEASPGH